jgi:hypothetical protein
MSSNINNFDEINKKIQEALTLVDNIYSAAKSLNELGVVFIKRKWRPQTLKPPYTYDCNTYNNELRDTSEECLKDLIKSCDIKNKNTTNINDYNNCIGLVNDIKIYLTTILEDLKDLKKKCDRVGPSNFGFVVIDMTPPTVKTWAPVFISTYQQITDSLKYFIDYKCNSADSIDSPPIFCCNNIINCEFGECINIVQTCIQTINGETKISNATDCSMTSCMIDKQECLAGTPGAGIFNWICQNKKWTKLSPSSSPSPPAPPPATPPAPPPATPPSTPPPPAPSPLPAPPSATPPPSVPSTISKLPITSTLDSSSVPEYPASTETNSNAPNYIIFVVIIVLILLSMSSFFVISK